MFPQETPNSGTEPELRSIAADESSGSVPEFISALRAPKFAAHDSPQEEGAWRKTLAGIFFVARQR
jgi:hypothetical protein